MSTDRVSTALRDLVDDVEAGVAPPVPAELWAGGRRRRRTARLVPVLAAACVAVLVGLLAWPTGQPRASVPAVGVDDAGAVRLTAFPSSIARPPFIENTGRPGVTAAVVTELVDSPRTYAVSPDGALSHLVLPQVPLGAASTPSLSPDGRWLARGAVLSDLIRGVSVPSVPVRQGIDSTRLPSQGPARWSPDSSRVFVDAVDQGEVTSSGVVVGTDGTVTEAPRFAGGQLPIIAGWLDDDTVLAFLDVGEGTPRLEGRTWRVGEPTWEVSDPDLELTAEADDPLSVPGTLRAGLSPDRSRVLVTSGVDESGGDRLTGTRATTFDARTGEQLAISDPAASAPAASENGTSASPDSVTWDGWGCLPAWRHGAPVITDRTIRTATPMLTSGPVSVSSRYEQPCVAFAGDEIRGIPVQNTAAVWQERLWVWGQRLLVLVPVGVLMWWFLRRRSWREGSESPRPFLPVR